uniref:RING-type E3 ubiquitin transferase n=1 Tax=Tetradesmus obliquus TaxID=3088 RepID=A0A383VLU4_TETOB|eukprot:jgi/Sobl393_1/4271/SZX65712.1
MATEDLCLVCADSLDYAGFGPCGHKDCCSRCVARLRFVMEDSKCMICKQECPQVFFTRYMGDYTEGLAPDEFQDLPARARAREVWELPEVAGYFDDQDHYKAIKSLCSYTHPMLPGAVFGNLNSLKRKLTEAHKLHFCDLCIKGRKVFISEQVLYSKSDLERHMRTGDDEGPMAESGFKGHPLCRFCRQRFYDGDELYKHMEGRHENCFICRRRDPNKFVYYKDYAELEEHFTGNHHPCPHPACLERKFVVFAEEAELKRHFATEHGGEMNLSRAQRRNLLTVNIQLNYAREQEEAAAAAAAAARPGVVIGGGHNLPRRGGMRHSRSEGAMAAAVAASIESSQVENVMRRSAAEAGVAAPGSVTFNADDFPTVSGQGSGAAPLGTWVGATGGPGSSSLTQDDFPALPTMSRNQRRKQRERAVATSGSLAGRLAAAGAPIRVVNRAAPSAGSSSSAAGSSSSTAAAAGSSSSSAGGLVRQSSSTGNLPAAAAAAAAGQSNAADSLADADDADDDVPTGRDDFPALSGGAPATQAHPAWVPVRRSGKPPKSGQAAGSSSSSRAAPSISDFPSLVAAIPASSRQAAAAKAGKAAGNRPAAAKAGSSSSSGGGGGTQSVAAAVAAAGGVSEELKAANKALIERCKALLSEAGFKAFREQSGAFMQGGVTAGKYHSHCVELGLTSLVPQLAALCPDADKRGALIAAHKQYLEDSQDSMNAAAAGGRGWVPPEAALAALQEVETKGSWTCERCTLSNAPSSRSCEVCSAPKPKAGAAGAAAGKSAAQRAAAGSSSSSSSAAAAQRPSQWQQAAVPPSSGGGSSSSSGAVPMAAKLRASAAVAARPPTPPAAAAAAAASPAPAVQSGGESWPTLAGPSSGRSSRSDSGTSSPVPQQQQASSSAASSSSSAAQEQQQQSGKKKKGTKTSLQELLATGKSHPQNAWSQTQRLSAVTAPSGGGGRGSMGQWGKSGGSKLAKKINAVNDAWGS